jgi:aspartate 1-decarboxylase
VVHVDAANRIVDLGTDPAAAAAGTVDGLRRGDLAATH